MFKRILLTAALTANAPLFATTATSLSSFGGIEEPQVIYYPSSNSFKSDSYVNITDLGGGVFQMKLRYNTSGTMWWDGDRTTSNTDRQRAEIKTLGAHQLIHQTFDYTTTWKMNPGFVASGGFCHITQLKSVDGTEGSSGAPMVTTSIFSGSSSAAVRYASAEFSGTNVFSPRDVRSITYSPGTFLAEKIRVRTTADGEHTGEVVVSLNGDSFQGVTNVEVTRPSATEYYPKWGFYRKVTTSSGFGSGDYIQHSNVSAGPSSSTPQAAAPAFSPGGGTYSSAQTVSISTTTSGATIRYTTDGSTPTETNGTVYSGPVTIGSTATLQAIAYESGFTDSAVTSATYTISSTGGGTAWEAEALTVTNSGVGTSVQTDANTSGGEWISLNATGTGQWMEFTLPNVPAGTYTLKMSYKSHPSRGILALTVDGAQVGSTLDQYAATPAYPEQTFGVVTFSTTGNHAVRLTVTGHNSASTGYVLSADKFTLVATVAQQASAPTFSPGGGTYSSAQTVSISTTTTGATIRYTTDGSTPTETNGTVYTGPITIGATTTLQAIAYESGFTDSSVSSATYTISTSGGGNPMTWEAEALTVTNSGVGTSVQTDSNTSGGQWISLNATGTGQWMEFTLPNVPAGTYALSMGYKSHPSRGILALTVDGTQVGSTLDQYAATPAYPAQTFGTVTFASSGNHAVRLTVTGHNSASTGYVLSADYFTLTPTSAPPPTLTFEAESLAPSTNGPTVTTQSDTNASGGVVTYFNATAVGDYVEYTLSGFQAGTYQLQFRYKQNSSRGQHIVTIDGIQVGGTVDEYSSTSGYTTVTVGNASFPSAGSHIMRLAVTGRNASSASYVLAPDSFTFVGQ